MEVYDTVALDVKKIIVDTFLDLCKQKSLHKISIQNIVDASGVSRQTFYNHFCDKLELIKYVYETRVIYDFVSAESVSLDFYGCCLNSMIAEREYLYFMKPALEITGPNCLADYMYEHTAMFDGQYHQHYYGEEEMPHIMKMVSDYHAYAAMHMHIQWILGGCKEPPEYYIDIWMKARTASMDELFFKNRESSPYYIASTEKNIAIGRE